MTALMVLGRVQIPENISDKLPDLHKSWPRASRSVWETNARQEWEPVASPGREYLDEDIPPFIDSQLAYFGIEKCDPNSHSIVLFEDVEKHRDDGVKCEGKVGGFFHLILSGSCTLNMPGLREKNLRKLKLEKGMAFWFNPNINHFVTDSCKQGVASVCATISLESGRAAVARPI